MIRRLFRQMSTAQILSSLMPTICMLIDSIVIARFEGVDAMSAYGLSTPLMIISSAVGFMLVNGTQVFLGKSMGKGDVQGAGSCFATSIVMSLVLAAFWLLLIFGSGDWISVMLGAGRPSADNPVSVLTKSYLHGVMLGIPFVFLSQVLGVYLQTIGKHRLLMGSVIAMTVANIVADLASVLVFHLGMFGIGLATSLSYLVSFAVCIGSFLKKDCLFRFSFSGVRKAVAVEIVREGSPILINQSFFTVRTYIFNRMLLGLAGSAGVAVFAVYSTIENLIFSIGLGTGAVTLMLSSVFFSDEDRASLHSLVQAMALFPPILLVSVVLIAEAFALPLMKFFIGTDPDTLNIAVSGFRIFMIGAIANNLDDVLKNYFQGIRKKNVTNLISFFKCLGFMIPSVYLFSRLFGLTGFWIGIVLGYFSAMLFVIILVWRKNGGIAISREAFSYLDRDFGARPQDCMEMSIINKDDAIEASKKLTDFCRERGMDRRTGMLVGLCVEEIAMNIIEHGFTKDRRPHSIDVRMVVRDDKRIIRIRDNCVNFDPTKYLELHKNNEEDPTAHIGLRMVMGMVKEAEYINTLGLNNLTMIL